MKEDLISRQAAIDVLEKIAELYPWRVPGDRDSYSPYNEAWNDALNRAESEIEALPSAQPTQNTRVNSNNALDTISRQAAIDAINKLEYPSSLVDVKRIIVELPSAQPEIIRCKDCKYVSADATCCLVCNREGMGLRPFHVRSDDFCSYAER